MAHVQELRLLPAAAQIAGYSGTDSRKARIYGKVEEESLNIKELGGVIKERTGLNISKKRVFPPNGKACTHSNSSECVAEVNTVNFDAYCVFIHQNS